MQGSLLSGENYSAEPLFQKTAIIVRKEQKLGATLINEQL